MGITALLPKRLRESVRAWRGYGDTTTSQGWDRYAVIARKRGEGVGEEWNKPADSGLDSAMGDIAPYIERQIIAPNIGPGGVVLEIGCGGGRWTERLATRCDQLIACDTSPAMLQLVKARLQGRDSRVTYLRLDGTGLAGVADASVDVVFSYDVFVHLPQWDIFNYLCETRRVLRPGGRAIIHHAHVFSKLGWENFLWEVPRTVNQHKPFSNFSVMTPEVMRGFVERAGLKCDDIRTDIVPRDAVAFISTTPAD